MEANEKRAKLRALELAEEEAREERIRMIQARTKRDQAVDAGENPVEEEEKKDTERETRSRQQQVPYMHPSDPSLII